MVTDLQKAGLWKRMAAWLLDVMLVAVLAVGAGALLSSALHYDSYSNQVQERYAYYEETYGVTFNISQAEFDAMTPQEQENYKLASQALNSDTVAIKAMDMVSSLILVIVSISLLAAILFLEFLIPLWLGNGQTVGKKAFGLGVVRIDSVRIGTFQLFARTLLGKYAVETMFPAFILLMMISGMIGIVGPMVIGALLLAQFVLMGVTKTDSAIHDLLAGTVVVDITSQQVFANTEELLEYTKKVHLQEAERKEY